MKLIAGMFLYLFSLATYSSNVEEESLIDETTLFFETKTVELELLNQLFIAIKRDDEEAVRSILSEKTINLNKGSKENKYCLHQACLKGNLNIVKILIDHGAWVNTITNGYEDSLGFEFELEFKQSNLAAAVISNKVSVVKFLWEKGARFLPYEIESDTCLRLIFFLAPKMQDSLPIDGYLSLIKSVHRNQEHSVKTKGL